MSFYKVKRAHENIFAFFVLGNCLAIPDLDGLVITRPVLTGLKIVVRHKLLTHNKTRLYIAYKTIVKINEQHREVNVDSGLPHQPGSEEIHF